MNGDLACPVIDLTTHQKTWPSAEAFELADHLGDFHVGDHDSKNTSGATNTYPAATRPEVLASRPTAATI